MFLSMKSSALWWPLLQALSAETQNWATGCTIRQQIRALSLITTQNWSQRQSFHNRMQWKLTQIPKISEVYIYILKSLKVNPVYIRVKLLWQVILPLQSFKCAYAGLLTCKYETEHHSVNSHVALVTLHWTVLRDSMVRASPFRRVQRS